MRKLLKALLSIVLIVIIIALGAVIYLFGIYRPEIKADFRINTGEVLHCASGFLYGLAEPDIPSAEVVKSIAADTFAQKTYGGLQHPVGDIGHVYETFEKADGTYLMVYCQDMYPTWYYQLDSLPEFYEKVRKTVTDIEKQNYKKEVVYCVFNESDNGVWFGDFNDEKSRYAFYESFREAYKIVKSINPDARVAGPGYCDYNEFRIKEFLTYCKENSCVPEVIVWHELGERSVYLWDEHFESYYKILDELGIDKNSVEVNISEYGMMSTNGIPGESVKWISRLEDTKVHGCVAYWRLADNLCDVAADDVMPNGNYWLYRSYAKLNGHTVKTNISDLFQSNFKNAVKKKEGYHIDGLSGVVALDEENSVAAAVAGGTSESFNVTMLHLNKTEAFSGVKNVLVKVYKTEFKGLVGEVIKPELYKEYSTALDSSLTVKIGEGTSTRAFYITVEPYENNEKISYENKAFFERYEAEDAEMIGQAKPYELAFAHSGTGFAGFIDTDADAVKFNVSVPRDGDYRLDIVYSNGSRDINDKRVTSTQLLSVDGNEEIEISYPSSLKYEHSSCVNTVLHLKKGEHTLAFSHGEYAAGLDFIDLTEVTDENNDEVYFEKDYAESKKDKCVYLVSNPTDGYCDISFEKVDNCEVIINSVKAGKISDADKNISLYLRRGISFIEFSSPDVKIEKIIFSNGGVDEYPSEGFKLDGAKLVNSFITDISSENGNSASVKIKAKNDGVYALTVKYANDGEGGLHDYNVDLIEKFATISVNGKKSGNYYFRNTYSLETAKTKTIYVTLKKGENEIVFSNDGALKFNGIETFAPEIISLSVAGVIK
ncbi:MAG: hypothetical protein K5755_00800 [Clostridiales bacterium]|nr:hypothetical protein [Clostridiales bacterium]